MKFSVASALLIASAHAANLKSPSYYEGEFKLWQSTYGVEIQDNEFNDRLQIFSDAEDKIHLHNNANSTYTLGHNEYSHLTWEEFRDFKGLGKPLLEPPHRLGMSKDHSNFHTADGPPDAFVGWWWDDDSGGDDDGSDDSSGGTDWVDKGAVTDVKDQGSCGSCWAFSTTGAMEGAYFVKNSKLVAFSEQMLVDCDHNGDMGCSGGLMDNAFGWIKDNGGLCSEDDYPYTSGGGSVGSCNSDQCTVVEGSAVTSWVDVKPNDDAAMMSALDAQPVAIAIEADQSDFQLYKSGVFTSACGTNLDHGVLAVGYGTMDGTDHYRVKNSWGPSWGDGGYIYLERGVDQAAGQCGMLSAGSYPVL